MVLVGLTRSRIEEIFDRCNYAKLIIRSVSAPHLLSHQGPYQLGSFFIPRVFPQKASLAANSSVRICRRRSKYGKGEKIEREATFYRHPAGIDISLRTLGVSQPVRVVCARSRSGVERSQVVGDGRGVTSDHTGAGQSADEVFYDIQPCSISPPLLYVIATPPPRRLYVRERPAHRYFR
ncbi:hypothetical protein GEV33_000267 [Tenebrio molitor]|uniref:Uncharacterized protein n=1 Tax=Tenebrio molitor TaxID=7067 RepID=A0A8J6HX97_TENMO|nr:hypothetical protein GEV33_000267 [Tenebrio molitor]